MDKYASIKVKENFNPQLKMQRSDCSWKLYIAKMDGLTFKDLETI